MAGHGIVEGAVYMISEELRNKILKAFEDDYIGDTIFADDEISEISAFVRTIYSPSRGVPISSYLFYICLSILIVHKSRNYGDDLDLDNEENHYWVDLFGAILNDETIVPYNNQKLQLDNFFKSYGKTWLKDEKGRSRRFKQTFLYNSFAPKYSIEAFIELIFDAYTSKENVLTGFFDDPFEVDSKPYINFVKDFSNKLRGIKDLDENVCLYNKWYHLSAAMRHGFAQDQEKVAKLVSRVVSYIKKYFLNEIIFDGTYFSKIVSDYFTKIQIRQLPCKNNEKVEKVRSIVDWYAYYSWDVQDGCDARLFIKLPLLKLDSINQYSNPILYLSLDGKQIYSKKIDIVGYDYNPHINPICIDITQYLEHADKNLNFKIEIFSSDRNDPIFSTDIKSSLTRPFLLFTNLSERENKDEIINPTSFTAIQVIIPSGLVHEFLDAESFQEAYRIRNNVYRLVPKLNEYISIGEKTVYFVDASKEAVVEIEGIKIDRISFESASGTRYVAYSSITSINIASVSKEYYGQTHEFEIRITNISDNQKKTIKKYGLYVDNEIRKNGISIDACDYDFICTYGINTFEIVRCWDDKVVTKISYFFADICVELDSDSVSTNGFVNVSLFKNKKKILSSEYKISEKNAYYQLDFGTIVVLLPYISFSFEGFNDNSLVYLTEQTKCQNIYSPKDGGGQILSLPACKIFLKNTAAVNVKIMIDEYEIIPNGNEYNVGKYLKDCLFKSSTIKLICTGINNDLTKIFPIYKLYSQEYVDQNGLAIVYDNGIFYYQISGFIGETNPLFKIEIFDNQSSTEKFPLITTPVILEGLSGAFTIDNFEEGYYNAILKRIVYEFVDYKEKCVLLRKESEDYEFVFGDPIKTIYNGRIITLGKIRDLCKPKEMRDYKIKDIKFIKYGIYPVFTGVLCFGNGKKCLQVEFTRKDGHNIVLYSNYDQGRRMFMNRKSKEIVSEQAPECDEIRSVYVKEDW